MFTSTEPMQPIFLVRISKKYELIEFITEWHSWIKQPLIYIENMQRQPKILVLF